ncbi:uncharacterized protein [Macrobrachium rosenbergii]|uniref:uncharacterized protein n=1 Tax=Macrobrachium rosenbergii TaxID=79674 RepID=UPI0034D610CF
MDAFLKLLLTTCLCLLSTVTDSNQLVKSQAESCRPRYMYIPWKKVRSYLNNYAIAAIPGTMEGRALKVRRCRCFLSPCSSREKAYCGVETEKVKRRKLAVVNERQEEWHLFLNFVEDESCRCMREKEYNIYVYGDVAAPPFIFNHTWIKRRK